MNNIPSGFTLEVYQRLVSDAAEEPIRLVLCDAQHLLMPHAENLSASERERIYILLAGSRQTMGQTFEVRLVAPDGEALRLIALVADAEANSRTLSDEEFARRITRSLKQVSLCASHVWHLTTELDEMTEELSSRYEELNLIYQLDAQQSDGEENLLPGKLLHRLLEDTSSLLQVSALIVYAPEYDLNIVIGVPANDEQRYGKTMQAIAKRLSATLRSQHEPLVYNRVPDEYGDGVLDEVNAKILAAPIKTSGGVIAVMRDLNDDNFRSNERKLITLLSEQISSMLRGLRDDLTSLPNRQGFERRLNTFIDSDKRTQGLVLNLDLHNFGVINEMCGRMAGDELLRQTADLLRDEMRGQDAVARTGGDEFSVLIEDSDQDTVQNMVDTLLERLRRHSFVWAGKNHDFVANIGAVPLSRLEGDAQRILSAAESACAIATETGTNNVRVYCTGDDKNFGNRGEMKWVPRIEEALRDDRFELYAQLIAPVELGLGHRLHQEILLRMRADDGALVAPGLFIPAAERFQLMSDIDRWVVKNALATLSSEAWQRTATQAVWSINLSGQSLSDPRFHKFLLDELENSTFPHENLCFEITETSMVANHRAAVALINTLQAGGVTFALDDFGSGLSSFSYLKNLPVDILKIDGCFVTELVDEPFCRATVDAVNRVGKTMGMMTVAEYVENDEILAVLRELGVDYAQGYGVRRPVELLDALQDMARSLEDGHAQSVDISNGPPRKVVGQQTLRLVADNSKVLTPGSEDKIRG